MMTSLAQWRLSYMRDRPTAAAPPYITGPMRKYVAPGHHALVSAVTARRGGESRGACVRTETIDSDRRDPIRDQLPVVRIRTGGVDERTRAAEEVLHHRADRGADDRALRCRADRRSASRSLLVSRPAPYIDNPMIIEPGDARSFERTIAVRR